MSKQKWNISLKIFISTGLITLFSILFVSISSYNKYSLSLMKQSSNKAQQIIELTSLNIDTYLDDLYRLSLSPYYDQDVMDALDKSISDSDLKTLYRTRTIEDFLEQILIIPRSDILRVFILTDEIYKGERFPSSIDYSKDYKTLEWYNEVLKTKKPIFISAHKEQIIKNPRNIVFSIVSILKSTRNTKKILGVIKVDANYSGISDICNQPDLGKDGGLFIMDSNKQLIFSNLKYLSIENLKNIFNQAKNLNSNYTTFIINNQKYIINKATISDADWTMIGVTSLSTINKNIIKVRNNAFSIAIICFLLSLLFISLYLYMFLNPLKKIIRNIKKIQDGNLEVTFPVKSNDELSYLAKSLNNMVSKLQEMFKENDILIHQIYEAKYLQKEAQINYLFNQIRPHFIFNTLNMISMLIQSTKYEEAVNHINNLSVILRGLTHLEKDIPVSTELELLDAYLTIQKNRYIDRLDYNIDVDKTLYDYIVPALLLQPLVENSVIHGCESKKSVTTIWISSEILHDNIIFIIKDNGIGMSAQKLREVRKKIEGKNNVSTELKLSKDSNGIALINVNKRIKIKFGANYGLTVDSTENIGTTIKVYLPKPDRLYILNL